MATARAGENTALSLYQLIGAPLHALIDAESQAAEATANFIERVGFKRPPPPVDRAAEPAEGAPPPDRQPPPLPEERDEFGNLRMVTFRYQRPGAEGPRTLRVDVPLLSLLPIPALQIKDARLEFFVKIVDVESRGLTRPARSQLAPVETQAAERIDFKAVVGRGDVAQHRSLDMRMKLLINVEQADIPAGLAKLFNLMEQNIASSVEPPPGA
jgi:hypothetical protein